MSAERTAASMSADDYSRRLGTVVRDLHDLADQLAREGTPGQRLAFGGCPAFGWAAHNVVHRFMWGVANLHLDGLIEAAARADRYAIAESSEQRGEETHP